ncbi:MAG: hypothetical protein KKA19_08020 [Candidatus Margulisbacteria bacterium]|nr:hypothetical protein [Candidatus Margulisiibacteriota bacterium]
MKKNILLALCLLFWAVSVQAVPTASNPRFDDVALYRNDPIASLPVIKIQVTGVNVSFNTLVLKIDNVQVTTINLYNYSYDGTDFRYQATSRLTDGWHAFCFEASDDGGAMPSYNFSAYVAAQEQDIIESALAIPNPASRNVRITYKLTGAGDIYINIYNLNAELVWQRELSAGEAGAQVGYNQVLWDLTSGFGEQCPNGPYLCVIFKKDGNKVVAMEKLKLFILR